MATAYSIYTRDDSEAGHALAFVATVEASSPEGAVRAHWSSNPEKTPQRVTVVPYRSVHHLTPKAEMQTRLRF
jgi:hypothetical protein